MAKKKAKSKAAPSGLDVALKAIEKKYGSGAVKMMGDESRVFTTISTGSIGLDFALGRGGLSLGRVYEVYGPPSGGKTTLTMSIMAQAQKRGMTCCFVDAEQAADPELFKAMGVNTAKLVTIENLHTGNENLDALEVLVRSGTVDVAVVDSVSSLIPAEEANATMEDNFMGLHARLMAKAMRKFVPLAGRTNTLIIFINQTRSKIGGMGNPETTTGGVALDFSSTGRIKVSGGEYKSSRIVDEASGEIVGHNTRFQIVKNKLGKPFREAFIPLIYGVGYDTYWETLKLAVDLGLIDKSGSWYSYEDKKIGQGEAKALAFLIENEDVHMVIRDELIELMGIKEYYEQNS